MDALLDNETVVLESLEFNLDCTVHGCDRHADVLAEMRCCASGGTMCTECLNRARSRVADEVAQRGLIHAKCVSCGATSVLISYDDLVRLFPL